jgi:uncharacterized membrane protein YedE/YeeE
MLDAFVSPWPWYLAGPLIGSMVPLMLWIGSRSFGISQNLEHVVAITQPSMIGVHFFKYDWRASRWSLGFAGGTVLGGFLAGVVVPNPESVALTESARTMIEGWGFTQGIGLVPPEMFDLSLRNLLLLFAGGVLVGFGTRYASGCTSGHAITGLSTLQPQSLFAVLGIFGGGMLASHLLTPFLA